MVRLEPRFAPGDRVRVTDKEWKGATGVVEKYVYESVQIKLDQATPPLYGSVRVHEKYLEAAPKTLLEAIAFISKIDRTGNYGYETTQATFAVCCEPNGPFQGGELTLNNLRMDKALYARLCTPGVSFKLRMEEV